MSDTRSLEALREEIWSRIPLGQIATSLRACRQQGLSREQVRTYLESIREDAPDEETEDRILEVLDLVYGFCSPHMIVWPDSATE